MSVVTKEEIEKVTDREIGPFPNGGFDYPRDFVLVGQLVAALVEERMKERVCEWCGEDDEIAFDERINEGWCGKCDKAIGNTTRAQYEADREGR